MAAKIGMNNAAKRINQEHAGWQRIEAVGKRRGLDFPEVNHLADSEGAAHVRHDKREPPTHFVVGEALIEPTKYPEASATDPGLLKIRHQSVYKPLGCYPLSGEARATKFIARNTLRNGSVH